MRPRDHEQSRSVALYWDFENLHASLTDARLGEGFYGRGDGRFRPQEPLIDIQAIVDLAASFGPVAINRAYCNWQFFGRYRDALLQGGVELIQLFSPGAAAKNGADIKLCLDAMEDVSRFSHIGTVIVVGGDSDFMPVSQKIKAAGRTLVGIGMRKNTNRHWARSCHEFRYYDSLIQTEGSAPAMHNGDAADIVRRAVRLLSETQGEAWVDIAATWHMIKRLDPTFDTTDHGFGGFAEMLDALGDLVETRKGDAGNRLRLR